MYTFWIFFLDFLRLIASLLFDAFSFSKSRLYVGSNFHLATDLLFLPFFNPFLSFSLLGLIVEPASVCYFLGWNLDTIGEDIFYLWWRLVVDRRGC